MFQPSKTLLIICFSLTFYFFQGCGQNYHDGPEMTFKINPSLIEDQLNDPSLGFSFSPPKNCLKIPDKMVQEVKDQFKKEYAITNLFIIEPYLFFLNEQNRFACFISTLPALSSNDSLITAYQQAIHNHAKENYIKQDTFIHNGFKIFQSLIIGPESIQFKLVVPQPLNKSFQIDYVIPKSIYPNKIEAIESSIGSLHKL